MGMNTLGSFSAEHLGMPDDLAVVKRANLLLGAGQSNEIGLCTWANVTIYPTSPTTFPAVQVIDHNIISLGDPGTFKDEGPRDLGPRLNTVGGSYVNGMGGTEMIVLRELVTNMSATWFGAKMAADGSSLVNHWNNASFPSTAPPSWLTMFLAFGDTQIARWNVSNLPERLIVDWDQGESDNGNTYATYLAGLQSLFGAIRAHWGNVRFILRRQIPGKNPDGNIRAAEESWVFGDGGRSTIVYADDLSTRDGAHFNDDPYARLSLRKRDALLDLVNGTAISPTGKSPRWAGAGPFTLASSVQGITPTMPAHQTNDILCFVVAALGQNNYTLTTPNGFVEFTGSPQHNAGNSLNARLQVWWVRATSSSMPAPVMGDAASDDSKIGCVFVIRGCRTSGNPFVDNPVGATAATSTSVSLPTLTTTTNNVLVMGLCAVRLDTNTPQFPTGDNGAAAWANSSLADVTSHINLESTAGAGFGLGIVVGFKASAGAVSATTGGLVTTSDQALLTIPFAA